MPVVPELTLTTLFSASLLALPPVVAVKRWLQRRRLAPFARDRLERHLVLASSLAGAAGAVAWSDALGDGSFLLGFAAPLPLAAVPWVAGELLSGASARRWFGLAAAAAVSCATSWAAWAFCFQAGGLSPSLEVGSMQLAAGVVSGLCAAHTYLAVRGEPLQP